MVMMKKMVLAMMVEGGRLSGMCDVPSIHLPSTNLQFNNLPSTHIPSSCTTFSLNADSVGNDANCRARMALLRSPSSPSTPFAWTRPPTSWSFSTTRRARCGFRFPQRIPEMVRTVFQQMVRVVARKQERRKDERTVDLQEGPPGGSDRAARYAGFQGLLALLSQDRRALPGASKARLTRQTTGERKRKRETHQSKDRK
eukprot:2812501-Rhodomonas_salina.1